MAVFKKTNSKLFTRNSFEQASNSNHSWKNYTTPVVIKEFGPIDYIDFSPIEPYHFAVTSSCQIQIYNPITKLIVKSFNKYKDTVFGGTFRKDGQLICAGGNYESSVKIFSINARSPLRVFKGHSASVHRTYFTLDGMKVISFSDDKTTALWDISSEKRINTYEEHSDYIRAGNISPISPNIYISGGYDKIVNMYDTRTNTKVLMVNHDFPVESIIFLPNGGTFISAGGPEIRVWDCLTSGKLLAKISQHHKTVTCLQISGDGQRIISGSLDRHVKIYDSGTYKPIHTLSYPNEVLSIGVSIDCQSLVAGMIDGMISIRQAELIKTDVLNIKTINYRYAGENFYSPKIDTYVHQENKEAIGKHDLCLRKFQYAKALDFVMMNYVSNKIPHVTIALLQELIRRQGLIQALSARDGKSLTNIFKFVIRNFSNIKFGRVLLYVTKILIDIYEGNSKSTKTELQYIFILLRKKLEEERASILALLELKGSFETILTSSRIIAIHSSKSCYNSTALLNLQKTLVIN